MGACLWRRRDCRYKSKWQKSTPFRILWDCSYPNASAATASAFGSVNSCLKFTRWDSPQLRSTKRAPPKARVGGDRSGNRRKFSLSRRDKKRMAKAEHALSQTRNSKSRRQVPLLVPSAAQRLQRDSDRPDHEADRARTTGGWHTQRVERAQAILNELASVYRSEHPKSADWLERNTLEGSRPSVFSKPAAERRGPPTVSRGRSSRNRSDEPGRSGTSSTSNPHAFRRRSPRQDRREMTHRKSLCPWER